MKALSAGLSTHLASPVTTLAVCWKITATDTTVRGFTSHVEDIEFEDIVYSAVQGFTPSPTTTQLTLAVSNLEVEGVLVAGGFEREDIIYGKWDKASVEIFVVNYLDLSQGVMKLRKGWVGEIQVASIGFQAEIRGLVQATVQQIVELYSPGCRAALGDGRCQVRLDPPTWVASTGYTIREAGSAETGSVVKPPSASVVEGRHFVCSVAGNSGSSEPSWNTTIGGETVDNEVTWVTIRALSYPGSVTSKTNNRVFFDSSSTDFPDNWFDQGKLTWLSGTNAGRSMEVKLFTQSGGKIELVLPMVQDVVVGDAYFMERGCAKDLTTACIGIFDNVVNFRGEPHVPQTAQASILAT